MSPRDCLEQTVAIRQRMLERVLNLMNKDVGAVSEDEVDIRRLELLAAQKELAELPKAIR